MPRYTNYTNGSLVSYGRVMMSVLFIVLLIFLTSCDKAKEAVQNLLRVDPEQKPDLIVTHIESSKTTLTAGETFELSFRVTNQGTAPAAISITPNRVRGLLYYPRVSTSSSISRTSQFALIGGTGNPIDFVPLERNSLGPSETEDVSIGIQAPSMSGTYYYGVCVPPVEGETATSNNCSEGHRVTVGSGSPETPGSPETQPVSSSHGSFAFGHKEGGGYAWSLQYGTTASEAQSNARNVCRSLGGINCRSGTFSQCGALAIGTTESPAFGMGRGATQIQAQNVAIAGCNRAGGTNCRIATGADGRAASDCLTR